MRVAVQVADEKIEIREMEMPQLAPGEVLVRMEGCGLCGSDLESYRGAIVRAGMSQYPHVRDKRGSKINTLQIRHGHQMHHPHIGHPGPGKIHVSQVRQFLEVDQSRVCHLTESESQFL